MVLLVQAWTSYNEDRLSELIDVSIPKTSDRSEVFRVFQIGLLCVQQYPEDRPNMSSVLMMLTSKVSLPHPKQPGFFIERKFDKAYNSSRKYEADSVNSIIDSSSSNQTITIVSPRQHPQSLIALYCYDVTKNFQKSWAQMFVIYCL